ncbi:DNA-binding transcriptional regulator, AcrR family [Arthrobacter alpinus]|uniref:DNA-binding transcriptional regulator, AcrR family n=2 Tax=Arthrobacter alpinus TaxID=656366 RepID=A0A1H5L3M0_9MICC|nr:DNA-binding transcriptional regulator, AcrR family [Arthrobacter alpinus]
MKRWQRRSKATSTKIGQMTPQAPRQGNTTPDEQAAGVAFGRVYSGLRSEDRALERRGRLIEAGIEVFGTIGYAASKIKTLCQSAGLSERYFYESFASREQLLTSVYDHLSSELMRQVIHVTRLPGRTLTESVRAGMETVVNFNLVDPRHAQIILVEIVGISPELEAKRHHSMTKFAAESSRLVLLLGGVDSEAAEDASDEDDSLADVFELARLTGVAMVGGVNNMLLDALRGGTTANTKQITEAAYQLISNASTGVRVLAGK